MATAQPVYLKQNGFKYLSTNQWNRPKYDKRSFSDGTAGQEAQNNNSGLSDGWDTFAGGSSYADDPAGGPSKVCQTRVPINSKGALSVGGAIQTGKIFRKGDVVYVGCRTYYPQSFDMTAVKNVPATSRQKFLRLYVKDGSGQFTSGYNDLYIIRDPDAAAKGCQFQYIKEGEVGGASWRNIGDRTHDIVKDTWESYQMAIYLDDVEESQGGSGRVEVFKNGELIDVVTNVKTINHPDDEIYDFLCFTYWDDAESSSEQTWYIDDAFVTNLEPDGVDSMGNKRFNQ